MKTILRFLPRGKKSALRVFRKKPIKLPSGKLQKLPAQKVGVSIEKLTEKQIELRSKKLGDISHRMKLGKDTPTTHLGEEAIRGEAIATKLAERRFNKSISKYLKQGRKEIAQSIKKMSSNVRGQFKPIKKIPSYKVPDAIRGTGSEVYAKTTKSRVTGKAINPKGMYFIRKPKERFRTITGEPRLVKSPKLKAFIKQKAEQAYKKADLEATKVFTKTKQRFTGRSGLGIYSKRTVAAKPTLDYREKAQQREMTKSWGIDPDARPDFDSDIMTLSSRQQTRRSRQLSVKIGREKKPKRRK